MKLRVSCGLLAGFLLLAADGSSQDSKAAADALFKQGLDRLAASPREALDLFSRSMKLDPSVGAALYMAQCQEQIGKLASAWASYNEAARLALDRKQEDRRKKALAEAARLEPRLPRLTVVVKPEARAPGLSVLRNGMPLSSEGWGVALPVDPEPTLIEVSAPGYRPSTVRLDGLIPGAALSITVEPLEKIPDAPRNARIVIRVPAELTSELTLDLDGRALPSAQWGQPQDVAPGEHAIMAVARCRETFRSRVSLPPGGDGSVDIPLLPKNPSAPGCSEAPAGAAPPASSPRPAPAPEGGLSGGQKAGIGLASMGFVGALVGGAMMLKGYTGYQALVDERDRKYSENPKLGDQYQQEFETNSSSPKNTYKTGGVVLGVSSAVLVGGALWALLSPGKDPTSARLQPSLTGQGGSLWLTGRW